MIEQQLTEFLPVGRCEFCPQLVVVMDTSTGSVLPVEVESKNVKIAFDEEFDSVKYKSHLLNCAKQAAAWKEKRSGYIDRRNPFNELKDFTELHR